MSELDQAVAVEPEPDDDDPVIPQPAPAAGSLRDQIAAAKDLEENILHVDLWNVDIGVRSMDGNARADLVENFSDENGKMSFRKLYPELLILCTFDPATGLPIFENTEADRNIIMSKAGAALEQVAQKAMVMSGLDSKAEERAGKS